MRTLLILLSITAILTAGCLHNGISGGADEADRLLPLAATEIGYDPVHDLSDGDIDVVVPTPGVKPLRYEFTITVQYIQDSDRAAPDPPMVIYDTVPADWQVVQIGAQYDDHGNDQNIAIDWKNGIAIKDSTYAGTDNQGGRVKVYSDDKMGNQTNIEWYPNREVRGTYLNVVVETRSQPQGKTATSALPYAQTSCGAFYLNTGAVAYELDENGRLRLIGGKPVIIKGPTEPLLLAAVSDVDENGIIIRDGTGDEDGDNVTDYDEVGIYGTDPCNPDTDGDGIPDGKDHYPLDPTHNAD